MQGPYFKNQEYYVTVRSLPDSFVRQEKMTNIVRFQKRFYEIFEKDNDWKKLHAEYTPGSFYMIAMERVNMRTKQITWQLLSK
ncbi:MAG: hypothetical protein WC774_03950 [Candidatus Gracilibacteria bacterium]